MLANFMQGGEIDLDQHGNDHDPDQQPDGQVDLCEFHAADGLEQAGEQLTKRDPRNNAQEYPHGKIAFKDAHRWACRVPFRHFCRAIRWKAVCNLKPSEYRVSTDLTTIIVSSRTNLRSHCDEQRQAH